MTRVEFGKGDPIRNVYGGLHLPGLDPSNPVQMGPGFFVDNRGSETQTPALPEPTESALLALTADPSRGPAGSLGAGSLGAGTDR